MVVANNTFTEADARGEPSAGRLAEWDGSTWTVLERASFTEVFATEEFSKPMICIGNDGRSALLMVHADGRWTKYRLPRHGHAWDQTSTTEWMRIREVETERALMDCYGIFYEVPFNLVRGRLRGLRPVSAHLRVVPDFCSWRGMLVLGGNQATPMRFGPGLDLNPLAGQPQAGLWLGKTDDLSAARVCGRLRCRVAPGDGRHRLPRDRALHLPVENPLPSRIATTGFPTRCLPSHGWPTYSLSMNASPTAAELQAIPADLLADFEAAARRPLRQRMRYAFIQTHKPVLDDAPFRAFDTTADYRRWCERNLPDWLGYGRVRLPPG